MSLRCNRLQTFIFLFFTLSSYANHASNFIDEMNWNVLYRGGGAVSFVPDSSQSPGQIMIQPKNSIQPFEHHSSLILFVPTIKNPLNDFQITIDATTERQLRSPNPNPWEVFTLFFNYQYRTLPSNHATLLGTNYLRLTSEGLEIGTLSEEHRQVFLATDESKKLTFGKRTLYRLVKKDHKLAVTIDNGPPFLFDDSNFESSTQLYNSPGGIGLSSEDAEVHIYSVDIQSL